MQSSRADGACIQPDFHFFFHPDHHMSPEIRGAGVFVSQVREVTADYAVGQDQ